MPVQRRNAEMADLLRPDLVHRRESLYALGNYYGAYMMIPDLRAFWPFGARDENDVAQDMTTLGNDLTPNATPTYSTHGICPYFDANSTYLAKAGSTSLKLSSGAAMGMWMRLNTAPGSTATLMGVWSGTAASYQMYIDSAREPYLWINGTSAVLGLVGGAAGTLGQWHFYAGSYYGGSPSTINVWTDGTKNEISATAGTLYNSSQDFEIGSFGGGSGRLDGDVALAFVSETAMSDILVQSIYQLTRPFFYPS